MPSRQINRYSLVYEDFYLAIAKTYKQLVLKSNEINKLFFYHRGAERL